MTLTDEDRAAIRHAVASDWGIAPDRVLTISEYDAIYLAGLRAGIERAAKVVNDARGEGRDLREIVAALRELAK